MSSKLPYVVQPGSMAKILHKIKQAKTPDRFTGDFLETTLGFRGGNNRQFIPLAKKIGLLNSDGGPTDLYKAFRNPATSGRAMAEALKIGYKELFERNETAEKLKKEEIKGLVVQITGLDAKDQVVNLTCRTFDTILSFADFDTKQSQEPEKRIDEDSKPEEQPNKRSDFREDVDLRLSYTINLVLPKTDDISVFNSIFKALRENLLRK